ncbi:hypothetical protein MJO29_010497 [Puccinia striiformis f. sp. tritici]|nr:hypothetical protein MJO29_010496 [Puccinia striiformis f. sp. tritici]KAI7948832.1 hypothetical protein MJO29_010497 [Puccinia striiformis f. sp. tritici]
MVWVGQCHAERSEF